MGKEEIALKLKQARIKSNMTQKQVADILGMTYQAISNYERGKTKVESDILIKLCKIYNISIHDVLLDTPIIKKTEILSNSLKSDSRLNKIIDCYNKMDEIGRDGLADQAEYLLSKHQTEQNSKSNVG